MTSFFEHQAGARRNTRWLLLGMFGAVLGTGVGLYCMAIAVEYAAAGRVPQLRYEPELWHPQLFGACLLGTALLVSCGSAFRMLSLRGGGSRVAEMMGARLVSGQPRDLLERRLLNVVEEMSIASGVPVPQVFVLETEAGINAFAAGYSLDDAAVAVTRGTLEKLTRDELQGVVAHEFSHVLNGDMRLNTRLMGTIYGILCVGLCGRVMMRLAWRGRGLGTRGRKSNGGMYLFVIGLGVFVIGWLGEFLAKLIKAAVSRQREFLADASAVQFTRNPLAVAGALKKIGGFELGATVLAPAAEEASHLFFCDLNERLFAHSWLATHPPLNERILRLEPGFAGEFPEVGTAVAEPEESAVGHGVERSGRGGLGFAAGGSPAQAVDGEARAQRLAASTAGLHAGGMHPFAAGASGSVAAGVRGTQRAAGPSAARDLEAGGALHLPAAAAVRASTHVAAGAILSQIGAPTLAALERGRQQIQSLPGPLREAANNPFSASALVYALLLSEQSEVERLQLGQIGALSGGTLSAEATRWAAAVRGLCRSDQLALIELIAPALRQLSAEQRMRFSRTVEALMLADQRKSIFEYVVGSMLSERLLGEVASQARSRTRHTRLSNVRGELELLLSVLAHAGDVDGQGAAASFASAAERLQGISIKLLPPSERLVSALGAALAELRGLSPQLAEPVVDACARAVLADQRVSADEVTLLRAVCDALRCPLPLLEDAA